MKDRIARAPGRYSAIVPTEELEKLESGNAFEITLVRDDDPEEIGTPYNKASVLPDDLAERLCPDIEDPTPADAFRRLNEECIGALAEAQQAMGVANDTAAEFLEHRDNTNNPHGMTAEQIGAVPNAAFAEKVDELLNEQGLSGHPANYSNPHYVTAEQVGAVAQEKHDTDIAELRDWAEGEIALQVESLEHLIAAHKQDDENPHKITCEQIGAVPQTQHDEDIQRAMDEIALQVESLEEQISDVKEDVEALVAEGKTVIVTLSNSTPSHTNEQIFNTVLNGGSVYLKMWAGTYIRLSWCDAEEALFEASLVTSIKGADGNSYPAQNFRTYRIKNGKYYANAVVVPGQAYIDAQIAYYFGNKEESL